MPAMRVAVIAALLGASVRLGAALRQRRSAVGRNGQKATRFLEGVPVFEILSEKAPDKEWLVFFQDGGDDDELEAFCKQAGISCRVVGHSSGGGIPFIAMHSSEAALGNALRVSSNVNFVAPDYALKPDIDPSPEDAAEAEDAAKAGGPGIQSASDSWSLDRIGVRNGTGLGVHVYVFDSGVKTDHEEFGNRAIPTLEWDSGSGSVKECKSDDNCAADNMGHGTHVAGIVGGKEYGVAPGATIHVMRMEFETADAGVSVAYANFDWLIRNKQSPAVLQMSFGWPKLIPGSLEAVEKVVEAGITVVVASGNSKMDACGFTFGYIPGIIVVAASDSKDNSASFTNYGPCTTLYAPGVSIKAASWFGSSGFEEKSGTSMAAPMVSGAAALLLEMDTSLTPVQVKAALIKNAEQGALKGVRSGTPNLLLSVGPPVPKECPSFCSKGFCWYTSCGEACPYC